MNSASLLMLRVSYLLASFQKTVWKISVILALMVESGKFTLKMRSESGKLPTTGCHLPPKSANFGTLIKNDSNCECMIEYTAQIFAELHLQINNSQ